MTIQHAEFDRLKGNPGLVGLFEAQIRDAISDLVTEGGEFPPPEHIEVEIFPGSIIAQAVVHPGRGIDVFKMQDQT